MPSRNQIRRRRATALGLAGLSIVLLTIYFGEPASGALHSVQRGAMEVLAPLQDGASRAIKPARDLINWVGDSFDAKSENKKLRAELADARLRLARSEGAMSENEQLRKLANFDSSDSFPVGMKPIGARVIVRSPNDWYGRFNINKGSNAGVKLNQPVIGGDGLVGRVTSVTGYSAQVSMLTDSTSAVAAEVLRRDILGVIRSRAGGEAAGDDLLLEFIGQRGTMKVGDMVVTSGTTTEPTEVRSLFPSGIPIGSISKIDASERQLYQRVHVKPYVDLRGLQSVQVLAKDRA